MSVWHKLKPGDCVITICALGIVAASFLLVYGGDSGRPMIILKSRGGEWIFPMGTEESMGITGPLGQTIVEIGEGSARIAASPCLNQVCVSAGSIWLPGQWSACLPNQVMLYIDQSAGENYVDATTW